MARYVTTIASTLAPAEAFAYLADFANAAAWDPGVREARLSGDRPPGEGAVFDLVARFAGRDVPLRYTTVVHDPPRRVVFEAERPSFRARDEITVEPAGDGSTVRYDATLAFRGVARLLDPLVGLVFARTGAHAVAGLRAALNP